MNPARSQVAVIGLLLLIGSYAAGAKQAADPQPIQYTLRFTAARNNYVDVEARVPTGGRPAVELMMAVWTPGSYLVREFERNVEGVAASADGRAAAVEKTAKNRWRIPSAGAREVTVSYRVYSREMTARTNFVDADFALINGAATFMTLAGETAPRAHDVRLDLPAAWKTSVTGMPAAPGGQPHQYRAADFDALVDSPIVAGNPALYTFTAGGKPHVLVNVGEGGVFDGAAAARDLERIVAAQQQFWGTVPYDRYVFFNILTGTNDGIEHRNSVVMRASRWNQGTRPGYVDWLSLASHEYFHLWNVKRLRPLELGPFDYEREVYPRSLWVSEGLTDYYGDLLLHRAGISTREEYFLQLSAAIRALQTTPGRLTQSVEMASFDAWIKQYRPDENSINTVISYYSKGAVLGFLLDARIRAATGGGKSLDEVMRLAFERYSGAQGFTPQQFRDTAREVAGVDLAPWFARALETTEELDYDPALDWYGLEFRSSPRPADPPGWLGVETRNDGGRLIVAKVPRGAPAFDAGVNPDDEIVAIDDFRIAVDRLDDRLESYRPGQRVSLLIARRDEMKRLDVTLGFAPPPDRWTLRVRPGATPEQRERLAAWLER